VATEAGEVATTGEHPFWMGGSVYRPAGDLTPGDVVMRCVDNTIESTVVTGVRTTSRMETVYNIEVDMIHTYIAGDFVVHNVKPASTAPAST